MAYCGPRGIPHSVFVGWEISDQDKALQWAAREAARYPDGTHPDDWDPKVGGDREAAFHTHIDSHPAVVLVHRAQESEEFKDAGPGAHVHLARGSADDCERCRKTRQANRANRGR